MSVQGRQKRKLVDFIKKFAASASPERSLKIGSFVENPLKKKVWTFNVETNHSEQINVQSEALRGQKLSHDFVLAFLISPCFEHFDLQVCLSIHLVLFSSLSRVFALFCAHRRASMSHYFSISFDEIDVELRRTMARMEYSLKTSPFMFFAL